MFLDNLPILSMLIWVPILGGIWVLIIGDQQERIVRHFSFFITVVTFLLSAVLYYQFDNSFSGMQFIEEFYWIEAFGIKYHLGVDGIALPLIMLQMVGIREVDFRCDPVVDSVLDLLEMLEFFNVEFSLIEYPDDLTILIPPWDFIS